MWVPWDGEPRRSPDMEYLEIVNPADFKTVDMPPATDKVSGNALEGVRCHPRKN